MSKAKIQRAKQHTDELRKAIKDFLDVNPFGVATRVDTVSLRRVYYVSKAPAKIPLEISIITGDVLQTLRSALDHLAYQLYLKGSGYPKKWKVFFPITDDYQTPISFGDFHCWRLPSSML